MENEKLNTEETAQLGIGAVGGSIFFNVPKIAYEKTRLKLSKKELEEFNSKFILL